MGFVYAEPATTPSVPVGRPGVSKRRPVAQAARGCDACPLQASWVQLSSPCMPLAAAASEGTAEADVLAIGEAPGAEEDRDGKPFIGAAGKLLRKTLPMRQMHRIAVSNIVRCRPLPDNRTPTAHEVHACSIHLEDDIARGDFKAILGLGGTPLSHFFNEAGITQVHGLKFPVECGGRVLWYFPTVHPSYVNRTTDRKGKELSYVLPIFQNDIRAFFRNVDHWPDPVIEKIGAEDVICAYSEDEARGWCAKLRRQGKPIGFDLETNGLRPNVVGAEIMTAAVSNGTTTVAWPVRHPQMKNDWGLPLLLEMSMHLRWIAHHAGFELAWLYEHARRNNIDWRPEHGFDDSMAVARLRQRRETCLNLGALTRLYTGINIKKLAVVNTERIAHERLEHVLPYNGLDAWGSWRIFKQLGPRVDEKNYRSILETIESVTEMQLIGLDVDIEAADALHTEWRSRADEAVDHARTIYEVRQYEKDTQTEFNIGSAEQVGHILVNYGRVNLPETKKSHQWATDDKALTDKAANHPLAIDTLGYRHAKKMDSTYIQPVLEAPSRFVDHRLHPVYSTILTKTLRLSCEDPSAQNYPKRKDRELRKPVVPPKGCLFGSADYGQLEARVYGMASRDDALCASIIAKEDIHRYWLDDILGIYPAYLDRLYHMVTPNDTEDQIREGGRDIIKSDFVFASFFGITMKSIVEHTGIPPDVVTDVLGRFWRRYSTAHSWLKARRREYMDTGTARNLCGVERYGIMQGNEPINTPIQSSAARLVLEAQNEMYQLAKKHRDPHMMPRINIHDDIVWALPDDDELLVVYIEEISKVLTKVRFDWQIVPLKVDWKIGPNWADMEKVYEYTGDYIR